ncbi:hypothetical protein C8F04DRAFT_1179541 [Mycena alexandri]|uniref:F-box domain-containing protein n=1 Tax=Mycena alexandri TaxID=1745969 RepID=A0AAD6T3H1_9AGAR|nr:hypothetical protein C8F04DRAFT_1179541 [Mycena alexandri]
MNVISLFKLALQSKRLFDVVMAHVRAHQPPSGNSLEHLGGGPLDRLSSLPVELFALILPHLTLADRRSLASLMASLCSRELQASVNNILRRFRLSHAEVRFMQSATMAVLGGQCIPHLLNHKYSPDHLEFHAPNVTYKSIVRFFTLATGCEGLPAIFNNLNAPEGFDDYTNYITYSGFTHLFGGVTHYGLWLGYAESSTSGLTMPNRECLDFEDPTTEDQIFRSYSHFKSHFWLDFNLRKPQICGIDWECPMTARSTIDNGCVSMFFPSPPMGDESLPSNIYPSGSAMSWSRGGGICPQVKLDDILDDKWVEKFSRALVA